MPLTVSNPRDLFLVALADALFVERLLVLQVMPHVIEQVGDDELKGALSEHREQTRMHAERAEHAFRLAQAEPSSGHSPPFVGLKEQHERLSGSVKDPNLADLVHADAAIAVEHYEIARYQALERLARRLELSEAEEALAATRGEEEQALGALTAIAERLARP